VEPVARATALLTAAARPAAGPHPPDPVPPLVRRLRTWTAGAGLVALAFSQQPGLVVGDTKTDLVLDPGAFLRRALHAWDPQQAFGQLQNQAYGYLWPMGPFFWLGHALHLPPWAVQRAWWSLLLVVGFAGTLRLAAALRIGSPTGRLVAAVAYAASPRVLTVLGSTSVEAWPLAVLPWVVLPLVRGADGSLRPRRAAALSGLAVACLGGVNAAATLAVLPLPALYLLTRPRSPDRLRSRLAAWWLAAVVLGTAWWVLPLLVLGRYAYPFLDQIENAGITTQVTTVANALRGASHWLGYLILHGRPRWPGGFAIAVSPWPVAATAAVAAAGLAGLLTLRPGRDRTWLLLGVLVGTVAVAVGHRGTLTGPLAPAAQRLLDGPLAPFRNVHKIDPVLRLPLALGLARLVASVAGRLPDLARRAPGAPVAALRAGLGALVAGALALTAAPAWGGQLAPDGGYAALPGYWRQVADWLAAHAGPAGGGRALLVPASNFADYQWGSPVDEPLQALARSPWAVRNAVPLGAPGATRLLDAVEARLATGQPSAALAPVLARAGVRYVVLRNDIDPPAAGSERPGVMRAALAGSPGIGRVAAFGAARRSAFAPFDTVLGDAGQPPAVELFEVAGAGGDVTAYPRAGAVALSGGPEATLELADAGLLADRAVVAAADLTAGGGGLIDGVLVTDTLRRRSLNFGGDPGRRYSPTLTAADDPAAGRPAGDVLPYGGAGRESVGVLDGAAAVAASSSAADPFATRYLGPDRRPAAAFDRDLGTAWISDSGTVGQWVELRLSGRVRPDHLRLSLVDDPAVGPEVTEVTVSTDAGSLTVGLAAGDQPQRVPVPPGPTARIRVTVAAVSGGPSAGGAVGVREVDVPGVSVAEAVALPTDAEPLERSGAAWTVVAGRPDGRRGDCVRPARTWVCVPGLAAAGEEVTALDRRFATAAAADAVVRETVRPRPGAALDTALDAALGFRATGSSTATTDPAARAGAAYDGDMSTGWLPAPGDPAPQIRLDLGRTVMLTDVRLVGPARDYAGVRRVVLAAGGQRRVLRPVPGRAQRIAPLSAHEVVVTLERAADPHGAVLPVRVADVVFGGAPARSAGAVRLDCGSGPPAGVDGVPLRTAVRARVADLLSLAPVPARTCGGPIRLDAGRHRIVGGRVPAFEVDGVTLGAAPPAPSEPARAVSVLSWSPEARRLRVAGGDAGFLALTEGFNAGWQATVDGRPLTPIRLDGWRQGWLLPPGGDTVVDLRFTPDRWHRTGLLLGLLALLALAGLATLRRRPGPNGAGPDGGGPAGTGAPDRTRLAADGAPGRGAATTAGGAGSDPGDPRSDRPRPPARPWLAAAAAVGAAVLLAGAAGLIVGLLALAVPARWRAAAAAMSLTAAGAVLGFAPDWSAQPALVQLLAVTSVALAAAAAGEPLRERERGSLDQHP
jgi:arabinofuranan 3-O-arabinosyltransferase